LSLSIPARSESWSLNGSQRKDRCARKNPVDAKVRGICDGARPVLNGAATDKTRRNAIIHGKWHGPGMVRVLGCRWYDRITILTHRAPTQSQTTDDSGRHTSCKRLQNFYDEVMSVLARPAKPA
jgi:hypothetical protein